MKKILFLALSFSILLAASAQVSNLVPPNGLANDTVTNTASKVLYALAKGQIKHVSIQLDITKISGTAAGTAIPVASNDGVTFYSIASVTSDTLSLANVTAQGKIWNVASPGAAYYGVVITGSGTMAVQVKGKVYARKP